MPHITTHDSRWSRILPSLIAALSLAAALLTTSSHAAPGTTAADFFVHALPGAPEGPLLKMHAGHIEVEPETNGNLFFWHYQNKHIGDRPRTVIWLNGGPGCSSEDGAMMEIGPYRVREGGNLAYNNGSWDEFANVLFVDNPIGTGYSYVNSNAYLHDLKPMADQFITFLEKWFTIFPEYEHDDLYIAGESYAGQHIPYIADAILRRNNNVPDFKWTLKGLLIGNGWISPVDQYPAYVKFALANGLVTPGSDLAKKLEAQQTLCMQDLSEGGKDHPDTASCESILQNILRGTSDMRAPEQDQCYNMYDVRLRDAYPSCGMNWPPDLTTVTPYLQREDVMAALHVVPHMRPGWQECRGAVGAAFDAHHSSPAITLLPGILESVPVILFSGDKDLICNHYGTENLIHNMAWNGGQGFELAPNTWAPRREWTFEGEPAGQYQAARNLTYIRFYNSSHMVPFDYPRRTRDMLDRFMGVDIASIGGSPADSRIDGEKGLETSVGGHPNSTVAEDAEKGKLKDAEWHAYRKSGEVILVLLIIAAAVWGWYVWRDRSRRAGYRGVAGGALPGAADVLSGARAALGGASAIKRSDLEAADFDESELDDLGPDMKRSGSRAAYADGGAGTAEKGYSLGSDDESDDASGSHVRGNGHL